MATETTPHAGNSTPNDKIRSARELIAQLTADDEVLRAELRRLLDAKIDALDAFRAAWLDHLGITPGHQVRIRVQAGEDGGHTFRAWSGNPAVTATEDDPIIFGLHYHMPKKDGEPRVQSAGIATRFIMGWED